MNLLINSVCTQKTVIIRALPQAEVDMVKGMLPYDMLVPHMPSLDFKEKRNAQTKLQEAPLPPNSSLCH